MMEKRFLNVDEVAEFAGVSKPEAYKIIREFNKELKEQGYFVIQGRLDQTYLMKRMCYQA